MSGQQTIGVFCSSSDAVDRLYMDVATQLGMLLAQREWTLVYGGGCIGLMGALARSVHAHGGKVVGVIPESMTHKPVVYEKANELIVTKTMRQRKAIMDDRSDAFVVLPGGFGTLEELFEVIAHRQLRYHDKSVVIVNSAGFYDPLITLFDHIIEHQFAKARHRKSYEVVADPASAVSCLSE